MEKLKILFITSKFPRYEEDTQPRFVYNLAEALADLGHEIHVVAPHDKGIKKEEVMNGIHIYRFKYFVPESWQKVAYGPGVPQNFNMGLIAKLQMPLFAFFEMRLAKKICKKINPDIVHAHWAIPQGMAARATKKPYVVTLYGGEVFLAKRLKLVNFLDGILRDSARPVTITSGLSQIIKEAGARTELSIIPAGIKMEEFKPSQPGSKELKKKISPEGPLVFFIGRLVEKKGAAYLIEAFSEVIKELPNAKLVIGGEGPLESNLKNQTENLKLSDNIIFAGRISIEDLPKYYCAADVFVAPSIIDRTGDRETQGVVLLEAMASKTAVIGTNTGGIPDVISNSDVGVLVPEKDSKTLARELIRLLKDQNVRRKYAENGQEHVKKNFTWKKIAKDYETLYLAVLAKQMSSAFPHIEQKKDNTLNTRGLRTVHYNCRL